MWEQISSAMEAAFGGPAPTAAVMLFCRIAPLVVFTPLLGGVAAPARFRIGLAVLLTLVILPVFLPFVAFDARTISFVPLFAKEILIGITLAIFVRVLFHLFAAAGAFMDTARGASMTSVLDPTSRQQASVLSGFFMNTFVLVFLLAGGHRMLLLGLCESFRALPPGGTLPPQLVGLGAIRAAVVAFSDLFLVCVQIATPVIVTMLVLDVAFALLSKIAPQIQVFFLSMTLKGTLGLLVLLLLLPRIFEVVRVSIPRRVLEFLLG
ncbi:MAG: flagellar biosynthetic protein FliR [Planctomycetes bacterium]|nr:flagellar biosynthetic protein FliR [Planctomycetota bacterium]MCB9917319.1 flagellar biosynthetic protein FliR [Planctomycetota bacterium]